jgi:hypothetical protein
VATEQDAARDRVLAAREDLAEQLRVLEASGRAAIDIPAKIKRSPAKAAAVAGGVGFLVLKGPQRLFRGAKRVVRGAPAPMPKSMLPDEIEKTLRKLGGDGERVRATLERDFAEYAKASQKSRQSLRTLLILSVARPLLLRGSKAAADALYTPGESDFTKQLAAIRERAERGVQQARDSAQDRIAETRRSEADDAQPSDEEHPAGP